MKVLKKSIVTLLFQVCIQYLLVSLPSKSILASSSPPCFSIVFWDATLVSSQVSMNCAASTPCSFSSKSPSISTPYPVPDMASMQRLGYIRTRCHCCLLGRTGFLRRMISNLLQNPVVFVPHAWHGIFRQTWQFLPPCSVILNLRTLLQGRVLSGPPCGLTHFASCR